MDPARIHHVPTITTIDGKLDELSRQVAYLTERQRKNEELIAEMTPILKLVMATATTRLDALEKKGYFAFGRELARVGERVVEGFGPGDVHELGDAVVSILETVRAMTRPEVLAIATEATAAIQNVDQTEPIGLIGMVRATRDDNVQKGMAVLMDLMRHVGRAASLISERRSRSPMEQKRQRLAKVTGAKKSAKRAMGVERTTAVTAKAPAPREAPRAPGPPTCAAPPSRSTVVAATIDGVDFAADGSLVDPSAWTRELALKIAEAEGVALEAAQWKVIDFARADFAEHGASPNIRRITQATGLATKDLYALFPKAPARTAARIAGLPKPAGCI